MFNYNVKRNIVVFSVLFIFIILLYISLNNIKVFSPFNIFGKESSISTNTASNGSDMTNLLARLINGEARGESYKGQVAVGAVVLNRVKSPKFPNTITGVIYQKNQFSCVKDGNFDKPIKKDSTVYKAAREAMNGSDPSNGALYFYNPKTAKSKWLFSLKTIVTIGNHRFANEVKK